VGKRHFRAGVVIVIRRDDGRVLAFERVDSPGQWQLPQGGLESREEAVEAAWRELHEETGLGTDEVELLHAGEEWIAYEWPPDIIGSGDRLGQVQRWFEFRLRDEATEPTPDGREFSAWRWVDTDWLIEQIVGFRRGAYERGLGGGDLPAMTR
jgi:putative (di)nucleoside polyphosphate hydrolase